jgi:ATP-dependent helicase/nuclease subunit A
MSNYLDTNKSIIISSPAGSGKTQKLAGRYIALLRSGVDLERILAITFTDKAATEMKQRILKILKEEDTAMFHSVLEKMPLMRVTTIHSFCGTLLRRFSFEASIDPNYRVEDAIYSDMMWEDMLYEVLMEAAKGAEGHDLVLQALGEKGFRGLDYLKNTADYLYGKNPFSLKARTFTPLKRTPDEVISELRDWDGVDNTLEGYRELFEHSPAEHILAFEEYFLTGTKTPRKRPVPALKHIPGFQEWALRMFMYWKDRKAEMHAHRTERVRAIYQSCLQKYTEIKNARGCLDFSDLEYLAYRMVTENPEWANILYAFDEKTDHILVDEFQDTNTFQWEIINSLTEEWRSGMGAKREEGIQPTVFFVGDEKQSIYFFRGANVEIFQRAKHKLQDWLNEEFVYEEVKENYRSRPAIIEFTNHVFSRIMQPGNRNFPWVTKYTEFHPYRGGAPESGRVEIVLLDDEEGTTLEGKQNEAHVLALRIKSLAGSYGITGRSAEKQRTCTYADMAILLRKRTHLAIYEEALRSHGIPFVAVKGVGFHQEPEVSMLRALVFFLSNPGDDYSLYILLKSPLFQTGESSIIRLFHMKGSSLFSKLKIKAGPEKALSESEAVKNPCLFSEPQETGPLGKTASLLSECMKRLPYTPLTELLEDVLVKTGAWEHFHEPQRKANIKKFIRLIEDLESKGKSLLKIREFLEKTLNKTQEAKANVNTEGMDAVKIMTLHASKGLEFPMVFVPGINDPFILKTGENLVYEQDGSFYFKSIPESSIRKQDEDYLIQLAKEEEEQKRLFYVAATRAEEALFLIGHWGGGGNSFLEFLKLGIGLERKNGTYRTEADIPGLSIVTADDIKTTSERAEKHAPVTVRQPQLTATPVRAFKQAPLIAVTETVDIRRRHGNDWTVLGDVIHRILEAISKGELKEENIRARAGSLLKVKGILNEGLKEKTEIIEHDIASLKAGGIWDEIILPRKDSFTELPFIYDADDRVYSGRIDRVIKHNDSYHVYDYKTFPVKDKEMEYLLREYAPQLNIYKKAVVSLFSAKDVKSFIVFTHTGVIMEI